MRDQNHWRRRVLKEFKENKIVQQRLLRGDFDAYLIPTDLEKLKKIREANKATESASTEES
jgi:hypothetical protein